MFLKDYWYVAATADEIGADPLARTLLNEAVVLYPEVPSQFRRSALLSLEQIITVPRGSPSNLRA